MKAEYAPDRRDLRPFPLTAPARGVNYGDTSSKPVGHVGMACLADPRRPGAPMVRFPDRELDVMSILWCAGSSTVNDVRRRWTVNPPTARGRT
jgi:hypothetical protein